MRRATIALTAALVLSAAACGDDAAGTGAPTTTAPSSTSTATSTATTAAPSTTATTAVATTAAPAATTTTLPDPPELPPTGVVAIIDQPYMWGDTAGVATQEDLPFPLGAIEARWYQAGDTYAVVYAGLDLGQSGPLCPGNSILGEQGPAYVSNSPTPGADCGWPDAVVAGPPFGTFVCDGVVGYITLIPTGTSGTLFASLEVDPGTGTFYGATGAVEADPDYMGAIDPADLFCEEG